MNVLVACEFSGVVRDAFIAQGHTAISCDLLPSESNKGPHIQGNVQDVDVNRYDLIIAHPPCTYLCSSGIHWIKRRNLYTQQQQALDFVQWLLDLPVPMLCLENPIGIISTCIRKPDQIIQPWMFGHEESKATCLWLQGLPKLEPTEVMAYKWSNTGIGGQSKLGPQLGVERSKIRSRTYHGIAQAMARQWGK